VKFPDYYALLGLAPDHDPDELREAFLARWREADGSLRGERVFLRHLGASARRRELLCEAFSVLTDPGLRSDYHRQTGIKVAGHQTPPDRRGGMACFREGCRRLIHRDHEGAYAFFKKAHDRSPEDVNFANYAVFSLLVSGQRRDLARTLLGISLDGDSRRAESMLLLAWMQRRSGAHRLAENAMRLSSVFPVHDVPLFLRLKQIPDLSRKQGQGILRRIVGETSSALRTPIHISTR
jgi:hypothetical protein